MPSTNLYVDVHILQDVPPANLNRDDTGSPKSARYGGVDRLRVSSQSWKRATRLDFAEHLDTKCLGIRTRRVNETVRKALVEAGVPEAQAASLTAALLVQIGITPSRKKDKDDESSYLLFLSRPQVTALASEVMSRPDQWADPDALAKQIDVRGIIGHGHSLDVALFGRMVADLPEINVDAAAQVSHALATHGSPTQFDYFTAVDDAQDKDEAGAGMIGTVEFNSATLYRYATVNMVELVTNMDDRDAALAGLEQFIRSFVLSMPSGKQNTFAAHTRPGLVLVQVRTDQPVNYMSAFERPVVAGQAGYLASSVSALATFMTDEASRWGDEPVLQVASFSSRFADAEPAFGRPARFDELVSAVRNSVDGVLAHE